MNKQQHYIFLSNQYICTLPKQIFDSLQLSENRIYTLCVGQISIQVRFIASNKEEKKLYLPRKAAAILGIASDSTVNIWRLAEDIHLGPIVGVFVHPKYVSKIRAGRAPLSVKNHILASRITSCFLYYFSYQYIDWRTSKVIGYMYSFKAGKWGYGWFSFPNVMYDRGLGFKQSEQLIADYVRQELANNLKVNFINSGSLQKWDVYTSLSKHPELAKYLPKTILYTTFYTVLEMLEKYHYIFLKSSAGYGAKEVMSIHHTAGEYIVTYYQKGLKIRRLSSLEQLEKHVGLFIKPKLYIIQQGIPAWKIKNIHMDLRILLQKDYTGKWKVTYTRARLAKDIFTIINSSLALQIVHYQDLFDSFSPTSLLPKPATLEQLALNIARSIEQELGSFGEIGMDMIVDDDGKVWFIEANSKPTKYILGAPQMRQMDSLAQFTSVLEYAKYLERVSTISHKVTIKVL